MRGRLFPVRRRLFALLSAVSLLLCVTCALLWARSVRTRDDFFHAGGGRATHVLVERDTLRVVAFDGWPAREPLQHRPRPRVRLYFLSRDPPPADTVRVYLDGEGRIWRINGNMRGLGSDDRHLSPPMRVRDFVVLRFSYGVVLTVIPPVVWLALATRRWHHRRRSRLAPGLCARCGYDLRASPVRCPECGGSVPTQLPVSPG